MLKYINNSLKFFIILVAIVLIFVFSTLWYFSIGLPDYKKLSNYQPPISSRVYSENGKLIAEYALEKRLFIPFESIPKKVINSFLSAEDKNFFNHPGVDAKGVLRALIKNLKNISGNKRLEGASTITQQVAKNFLLTNEVSLKRKIKKRKNGGGLWDADHIIPVKEGGGQCGLDNIRTLCISCHKKVTKESYQK